MRDLNDQKGAREGRNFAGRNRITPNARESTPRHLRLSLEVGLRRKSEWVWSSGYTEGRNFVDWL